MARREYKGAATPTTITGGITNSSTSLTLTDATNWPTGSFSLVIDPGLAGEEKILAASRSGTTVTLTTRGYDNTTASSHTAGAIIYPVPTAIDFDEANALVNTPTTKGDILAASAASTMARVAVGANNKILTADSSASSGVKWGDGPLSTKGDLYTYDTAGNRLAVGNNGETLVADSSTSTGLRYQATMAGGKNAIINGGFDIWQRGTSFTTLNNYIADRWFWGGAGTGRTISRQTGTAGCTYAIRMQRDSGNTSTNSIAIGTSMEIAQATPLQGKTITVSFYAKAGANYSGASSQMTVQVSTGTSSTEANRMLVAYASGDATPLNDVATLTTSWQRFSYNVTLASNVTQFFLYLQSNCSGTAGAADYVDITGAQIEVGSVATQFSRAGATIQGELAACERYYQLITRANGMGNSTTRIDLVFPVRTSMRGTPSVSQSGVFTIQDTVNTAITQTSTSATAISGESTGIWVAFQNLSGAVQYRPYLLNGGTLQLSAEL